MYLKRFFLILGAGSAPPKTCKQLKLCEIERFCTESPESASPGLIAQSNRLRIYNLVTFSTDQPAPRVRTKRINGNRHEYIASAGDADGPLFRTAAGKTGKLTGGAMWQQDAYRMIQRRAAAAGIKTRIGNHTFRATGITAYLKNNGKLEVTQHIANHESPRTTKLYDRRQD
jgi:Phage integrase family